MRIVQIGRRATTILALFGLSACALFSTSSTFDPATDVRPASDLPARFEPIDSAVRLEPADTLAGSGCLSPLLDPRDGLELRFVRSGTALGDYEVPEGRYGVQRGELLRIECNTGEVVGIVRR